MRTVLKALFVVALTVGAALPKAHAQWVVFDPANWLENMLTQITGVADLLEQYKQLEQLYRDYENQKQQLESLTKSKNWVWSLRNTFAEQDFYRNMVPNRYADALLNRYTYSHGSSNPAFNQALRQLREKLKLPEVWDLAGAGAGFDITRPGFAAYDVALSSSQTGMAAASASYDSSQSRMALVDDLLRNAGGQSENLIQAVNANTRMQGEVAYLLGELIRLNAMDSYSGQARTQQVLAEQALNLRSLRTKDWGAE